MPGAPADQLVAARSVLLDALLQALQSHIDALILIGAQAIYLHTGAANIALAESTKDSDLALDTRHLAPSPLLEQAMREADFCLDPTSPQPGSWLGRNGLPVDLMVPEALAGQNAPTSKHPSHKLHATSLPSLAARRPDRLLHL